MNRRRILIIVGCGLVAALLVLIFSSRRNDSVPLSAINDLHDALIKDGYKMDRSVASIDEIVLPRVPGVRAVVKTFYPDYRKQIINRSYSKDGKNLGLDYAVRGEAAIDVSLPADLENTGRARRMARELAAINPNLSISLRTNEPPMATKR